MHTVRCCCIRFFVYVLRSHTHTRIHFGRWIVKRETWDVRRVCRMNSIWYNHKLMCLVLKICTHWTQTNTNKHSFTAWIEWTTSFLPWARGWTVVCTFHAHTHQIRWWMCAFQLIPLQSNKSFHPNLAEFKCRGCSSVVIFISEVSHVAGLVRNSSV